MNTLPLPCQVIGIVVASSAEQARQAASLVCVTYGPHPSPPVYTIDSAIAAGSFFDGSTTGGISTDHELEAGADVEAVFKEDGVVRGGGGGGLKERVVRVCVCVWGGHAGRNDSNPPSPCIPI